MCVYSPFFIPNGTKNLTAILSLRFGKVKAFMKLVQGEVKRKNSVVITEPGKASRYSNPCFATQYEE